MTSHVRADIAYVAGRLVSGKAATSVYDFSQARHLPFRGSVSEELVKVFDCANGCFFGGRGAGGSYRLYHYGDRHHITLKIEQTKFTGYDYATNSYYSGTVTGTLVSIFDHQTASYFTYTI